MKNLIFIENRPETLQKTIQNIKEQFADEVIINTMLYYCKDAMHFDPIEQENQKKLLGIDKIICVDFWNFAPIMDELYQDEDALFICNLMLDKKKWDDIDYKVNVYYALDKKEDGRIWFYTDAGQIYKKLLSMRFPNHVLDIQLQKNGGILFDLSSNSEFIKMIHA